jgi:hypothetical protein
MTQPVVAKLEQLKELDAHREIIRLDKQAAINSVLTDEIKTQLRAIDAEFDPITENINNTVGVIEAEIKEAVLSHGVTVKGAYTAIYANGRVSWDTKALDGYAAAHPEIERFKTTGSPSVSIRRK